MSSSSFSSSATSPKRDRCFICIDTECVGHYSDPDNQCFAFAAVVVEPIPDGDDVRDVEVRRRSIVSTHSFRPERRGKSNKRTREFWQQAENKDRFGRMLAECQEEKGEIAKLRALFNDLRTKYKRVELVAWPATVDAPVIDTMMFRAFPEMDWQISWQCIRTLYDVNKSVYQETLEFLQTVYGKQHDPMEDATWAAMLWVHMLANPPHLEVRRLVERVRLDGTVDFNWWMDKKGDRFKRLYEQCRHIPLLSQ
jgi:hypothetical protein